MEIKDENSEVEIYIKNNIIDFELKKKEIRIDLLFVEGQMKEENPQKDRQKYRESQDILKSLNLKTEKFKKGNWLIMSKDKNIHNISGKKDFWLNNFIKYMITMLKSGEYQNSKFWGIKEKLNKEI